MTNGDVYKKTFGTFEEVAKAMQKAEDEYWANDMDESKRWDKLPYVRPKPITNQEHLAEIPPEGACKVLKWLYGLGDKQDIIDWLKQEYKEDEPYGDSKFDVILRYHVVLSGKEREQLAYLNDDDEHIDFWDKVCKEHGTPLGCIADEEN